MPKSRRFKFVVAFLTLVIAAATLRGFLSADRLRRNWKQRAIPEITRLASDAPWVSARTIDVANQTARLPRQPGTWVGPNIAIMQNGQSIVFRNDCSHQHPLLGDIFIGKASNRRWYYSNYHFCQDMVSLQMDTQPADLQEFISRYALNEFDGQSDEAIKVTWAAGAHAIR